jgi:hypothetical protein
MVFTSENWSLSQGKGSMRLNKLNKSCCPCKPAGGSDGVAVGVSVGVLLGSGVTEGVSVGSGVDDGGGVLEACGDTGGGGSEGSGKLVGSTVGVVKSSDGIDGVTLARSRVAVG